MMLLWILAVLTMFEILLFIYCGRFLFNIPVVQALGQSRTYLQRNMEEFSVLPYVTPKFDYIEDLSLNDKRKEIQLPCYINNFDYKIPKCNIAYGCILNGFRELKTTNFGAIKAIKHILGNITSRKINYDWSHLTYDKINITFVKGLELRYTHNGKNWTTLPLSYISEDYTPRTTYVKYTLGITYFISFNAFNKDNRLCHHNITVTYDQEGEFNLLSHTYVYDDYKEKEMDDLKSSNRDKPPNGISLRILTYNAWNTNPPPYIIDKYNRVVRYNKRMKLFTQYIRESNAAIACIQEVRFDEGLGKIGDHSQIERLVSNLPEYPYYVYQAADIYMKEGKRIEEGMMIFSKYPILSCDYRLLSRYVLDENDFHQRILFHCIIHINGIGEIDVYTSHLSLSEKARKRSVIEIYNFMKNDENNKLMQVLVGDLNSKSDKESIQFLSGIKELNGIKSDLKDSYKMIYKEEMNDVDLFTFESNRPRKRIDYILYRNSCNVSINDYKVIGQKAYPGSENRKNYDMIDKNSPIYASDHRGVFVDMQLLNYESDNWNKEMKVNLPSYDEYEKVLEEKVENFV